MKDLLKKHKITVELTIVLFLFLFIVLDFLTFSKVISYLLMFIVLLEVVRMLTSYIFGKEPVMKLRFIIDGFIIFFLRDLVLIFSEPKYNLSDKQDKLILVVLLISALFIFRAMSLYFSPNDKNCDVCPSKNNCDLKE